ncbi:hypothetical protein RHSIM_Rhsim02G0048900 [Rhododendron simsii]|uniref:Uncharacterized protein n=1 Tax=Rhododendron simsii TaxID=118357 RepID=A0A834HIL8_RHOSS|nr:hypothetical protein RHSIM_Rhsim02G0048900 [Rhododendron simsii]
MKPSPVDYFAEMDDHGSSMAMDVDDNEALEIYGYISSRIFCNDITPCVVRCSPVGHHGGLFVGGLGHWFHSLILHKLPTVSLGFKLFLVTCVELTDCVYSGLAWSNVVLP